jgi:RecB family endonuclease NucS
MTEEVIEEVIEEAPKVDFYLKLTAESDMPTVLADFYGTDEEGNSCLIQFTHDYAIDVVGTIYEPTGETLTDDEGVVYPEMAPADGWHVNVRLVGDAMRETVEALDASHGVTPNSPSRVWL